MDTLYFVLGLALVIMVWVTFILVARHRGAGCSNRRVRCPEKDLPASIGVLSQKTGAGAITRRVLACLLSAEIPVTCDQGCLTQL